MPERRFHIRWPDGEEKHCYSPSSVIHEYLTENTTYPLLEFVALSEQALQAASERVRQKYGYACSSAMGQLSDIKKKAESFNDEQNLEVTVKKIS